MKDNPLLKRQEQTIRAKMQMKASNIADRVVKFSQGELKNPDGELVEMSTNQLKAAEMILSRCVPTLSSTSYEDVTPERTIDDIEGELEQLRKDTEEVKGIRLVSNE